MSRPWRNLYNLSQKADMLSIMPSRLKDKELFVWLLFTHIIEGKSQIVLMYPKPCVGLRRCFSATNTCQLKGQGGTYNLSQKADMLSIMPSRLKDKELFVWLLFTHIIEGKSHIVLMYPKPCVGWRRCFSATNTCQLKGRTLEIICQQRQLAKRVPMRITGRCINLVYYFKFIVYVVYLSASTNPGQFKWTTL